MQSPEGWIGSWSPGIGDPSFGGWLTVFVYFLTALLCWRVVSSLSPREHRERLLWRGMLVLLLALGINKQLDLQTALTEFGRILAHAQGWYEQRFKVQVTFMVAIALVALAGALLLVWLTRRAHRAAKLAALGMVGLFAFVALRASSFHHMDRLIDSSVFGLRSNWLLELGGLFIICFGASWRLRTHQPGVVQARQVHR